MFEHRITHITISVIYTLLEYIGIVITFTNDIYLLLHVSVANSGRLRYCKLLLLDGSYMSLKSIASLTCTFRKCCTSSSTLSSSILMRLSHINVLLSVRRVPDSASRYVLLLTEMWTRKTTPTNRNRKENRLFIHG
jgi:hypothetical protein